MNVNSSLIISTYNWPAALKLCLKSVKQQHHQPDEVIIADDGSGEETRDLINSLQADFPVPLIHVWHADKGFRLAAIRNKAIAAARGSYIIQIDGDLILHPWFVGDHLALRQLNHFFAGSRVMLNDVTTQRLIEHDSIDLKKFRNHSLSLNDFRNPMLSRFLAGRYKIKGKHIYYVKGCNMAFEKCDLIKVNGYNEAFNGWGSEDREIAIRLINSGVQKRSLKMRALCYHLYHKVSSQQNAVQNEEIMRLASDGTLTYAKDGLDKYLAETEAPVTSSHRL